MRPLRIANRSAGELLAQRRRLHAPLAWASWLCACWLAACSASDHPPGESAPGEAFFSPEAVASSEAFILVANTGHQLEAGRSTYAPGSITLVARASRRVVGRVPTSQLNPRAIVVREPWAYVLNSGGVATGEDGVVRPLSPGGIDLIDLGQGLPTRVAQNIPLPLEGQAGGDTRIGAFGSLAISPDGEVAYLGSGTRGDVFCVDLQHGQVARGVDDPIVISAAPAQANGLTVVRPWGTGLAILSFGSDELCLSERWTDELASRRCGSLQIQRNLLGGPLDIAPAPDGQALVLMTLANSLFKVDIAAPSFQVNPHFAGTGNAPNRLVVAGDQAYVVNSLSNNIERVSLATGQETLPWAVLPLQANPTDLVFTEEGDQQLGWVPLFQTHQLAVVAAPGGEQLELIDGREGSVADAGRPTEAAIGDGGPATDSAPEAGAQLVVGIGSVVAVRYGEGAGHGQDKLPGVIQGGPLGGGASGGSADVLSLGLAGELVVDFGAYEVVDGPGPDLIIFENSFLGGPYAPFAEPAHVALSPDGSPASFSEFFCDLAVTVGDEASERWPFSGCAGVRPVLANVKTNSIPPTDPAQAGGDPFDLAVLGLARARFLRLRDAGISTNGTTSKGFDLDAIVLINYEPR